MLKPPAPKNEHPCPKCGSGKTRMVGRTSSLAASAAAAPPVAFIRCDACGFMSTVPQPRRDGTK